MGRIAAAPDTVGTVRGVALTYWVVFDEPQGSVDGDDTYSSSQVLEKYIQVLDS